MTVTCTPTASAIGNAITNSVSVAYTASVTAVAINPAGAVQDSSGNWNILVGQHCAPTLGGVPSGTGWSTTYQRSVSGSTFQSWTASSSSTAFTSGPGPLNVASPGWYWNDPSQKGHKLVRLFRLGGEYERRRCVLTEQHVPIMDTERGKRPFLTTKMFCP